MYEFLKKLFKEVDGQPEAITAEELIKRIQADKSLNIVNLKDGGYVSKDKFDAKETELSGVKQQLTDANATIQSYKDMDIEGIKKSAQEWENKYKTDTKALNDKLAEQERAHQTDMFLSGYKFTSKAAQAGIRAEFEKKGFKLEDGVFLGAKDYMKSLMEDVDYKGAFVQENPADQNIQNGGAAGAGGSGGVPGTIPGTPLPGTQTQPQKPLPQFAAGTNGGAAGAGSNNLFGDFHFTTVRPVPGANNQ